MNMKKIILIVVVMFCFEQSFAQVDIRDLKKINGKLYDKSNAPYSGEFVVYNEVGKIQAKGILKEGVPDGLFTTYNEDGTTASEITFKNGAKNGIYKEYYDTGNLKQVVNEVDNKDDGKGTMYYETGEKHVELNFDKGVQIGDYIEYDKKGSAIRKLQFINGKASFGKQMDDLISEANVLASKYKSDDATALYTKAISIDPTIPELYFYRGPQQFISSFKIEIALRISECHLRTPGDYVFCSGEGLCQIGN